MSTDQKQTQFVQDQADKTQLTQVLQTQETKLNSLKSDNASQSEIDAVAQIIEETKRELNKLEKGRDGVSQLKDIP